MRAAPTAPPRPRLVLVISVDQLRTDYLDYLAPLTPSSGFATLKEKGAYLKDVEWLPANLDAPSATAMLMTGAYPSQTGLPSATRWNPSSLRMEPALSDPSTIGVNTPQTLSPKALLLSTLSDELMIDGAGLPQVHAIAADPQVAMALAGHAAQSSVWLNSLDGRWATSSYYKELPLSAQNRNTRFPLSSRVDTMQWKPLLPIASYPGLPAQKRQYEFRHTFPSRAKDVYERFAASPKGNEEVTALALDLLKNLNLGRRGDTIDMLALAYTAAPFRDVRDGDYRAELQDTYLRLDAQIDRLLRAVDQAVGLNNCVILLSSTGYYDDAVAYDSKYRIPTGDFSTKRAMALLSGFYTAKYGPGDYVASFSNGGFHLNEKTFQAKGVSLTEAAAQAKEFLLKMSGVSEVYTLADILSPDDDQTRALRLSTDPRTAPALTLILTPGWNLVEDHTLPVRTTPIRRGSVATPAFIMAPGVGKTEITRPVDARALVSTICSLLHIRTPDGAQARPLIFP